MKLKFESEDKDLLILIGGITKRPNDLTQTELEAMKKAGDIRVTEDSGSTPVSDPTLAVLPAAVTTETAPKRPKPEAN